MTLFPFVLQFVVFSLVRLLFSVCVIYANKDQPRPKVHQSSSNFLILNSDLTVFIL